MVTTEELEQVILDISKSICKENLVLIPNIPNPLAIPTNCFANVLSVQTKFGGESKAGWTFFHRYSAANGDYLIVSHHAVWLSPSNFLVDVTPFHSEAKHQPRTKNGKVVFLPDEMAVPIRKENLLIPLPSRFFAIKSNPKIGSYIQTLQKKEFQYYRDEFGIDFL